MSGNRVEKLEQRLILANKRIVELEAEVEEWRTKAEELALGVAEDEFFRCSNPYRLSRYQMRLLVALLCRPNGMSRETLLDALYVQSLDPEPDPKILDVMVCKVRNKLEKHGVSRTAVETLWGRGYRIADDWRKPLAAALGLDLSSVALNYDDRRFQETA